MPQKAFSRAFLCLIEIKYLPLHQHAYPASRKISALRVSLFLFNEDKT